MEYPIEHFFIYCDSVYEEMCFRGYKCDPNGIMKYADDLGFDIRKRYEVCYLDIFSDWHNDRYLRQCYFNLQEKYDAHGIEEWEWSRICDYIYENGYLSLVLWW